MKNDTNNKQSRGFDVWQTRATNPHGKRAFTLIEMIGVMAVLAILALAFATILIKQLDRMAWEKETSQLKAFAGAYRQGVLKSKSIPNQTAWAQFIATNLGLEISQVRTNDRRVGRVFLIDPTFQIDVNTGLNPSYVQTASGATNQPVSPRLMILSSISGALPTNLVSGIANSTTAFNNIWDAAEGTIPAGWTWSGKGEDLKVQRIHLGDLFLRLELNRDPPGGSSGRYAIEAAGPSAVPGANPFSRFFIDGTHLGLHDDSSNLEYSEILHRGRSFYFVLGTWRSEKFLGRTVDRPGAIDLERAAARFMSSKTNGCALPSVTTWTVRAGMIGFMSNYVNWCQAGFPGGTTDGNTSPNNPYDVLTKNQSFFGSQAYMSDQANKLICPQVP